MLKRILILACCILALSVRPAIAQAHGLRLLAGTTILSDILRDLAPHAEVRTLIPGGSCPGHHDMRPGDIRLVAEAGAIFLHDWQEGSPSVQSLLSASGNSDIKIYSIKGTGNPLVPSEQKALSTAVANALMELAPSDAPRIQMALQERLTHIDSVEKNLRARINAAHISRHIAVCAAMQADLAKWMGITIACTFGRPADMTPASLAKVIADGTRHDADIIIDNLQSGCSGDALEGPLGAKRVVFTNFPDGFQNTPTWAATITANTDRLLTVLHGAKGKAS